ncbi:hypothetical protein B0T21DRAFT_351979 [Apiosordaria backusii]|uniref:Uncharacterized protein n=1 Tax=Apiosordaria backusii TaxID=314023 RepID=A0AA40DYS8_9PEZI|nr:hypothetical protein B0T21DRAFT_351979 [Apiosordaria backusii]
MDRPTAPLRHPQSDQQRQRGTLLASHVFATHLDPIPVCQPLSPMSRRTQLSSIRSSRPTVNDLANRLQRANKLRSPASLAPQDTQQLDVPLRSRSKTPFGEISINQEAREYARSQAFDLCNEPAIPRNEHHDKVHGPVKTDQNDEDDKENHHESQSLLDGQEDRNKVPFQSSLLRLGFSAMVLGPRENFSAEMPGNEEIRGASMGTTGQDAVETSSVTTNQAADEFLDEEAMAVIKHPRPAPHYNLGPSRSCLKRNPTTKQKARDLFRGHPSTANKSKQSASRQARKTVTYNDAAICLVTGQPYHPHERDHVQWRADTREARAAQGMAKPNSTSSPSKPASLARSASPTSPPRDRFEAKVESRLKRSLSHHDIYKKAYLAKLDKFKDKYKAAATNGLTGDDLDAVLDELPPVRNYMRRCTMEWQVLRYNERVKTEGEKDEAEKI